MFGPLGQRSAGATRRSRRRLTLVVVGVLCGALVVGEVVDQVVQSGAPTARRSARSWVVATGPIITNSDDLGATLDELRRRGPSSTRRVLDNDLTVLVAGAANGVATLANLGLPLPSGPAPALLADVLAARRRGVADLVAGVALATGPGRAGTVNAAAARLFEAGREFALADARYRAFRAALPKDFGGASLPVSAWAPSSTTWSPAATRAFAARLAAAPQLAERDALAIVAVSLNPSPVRVTGLATPTTTTTTLPPKTTRRAAAVTSTSTSTSTTSLPGGKRATPATTTSTTTTTTVPPTTTTLQIPPAGSVSEIAATSAVRVIVVVANVGTFRDAGVLVTASLVPRAGRGAVRAATSERVGTLGTGESRYLVLPGLRVVAGARYALVVRATARAGTTASRTITLTVAS